MEKARGILEDEPMSLLANNQDYQNLATSKYVNAMQCNDYCPTLVVRAVERAPI